VLDLAWDESDGVREVRVLRCSCIRGMWIEAMERWFFRVMRRGECSTHCLCFRGEHGVGLLGKSPLG